MSSTGPRLIVQMQDVIKAHEDDLCQVPDGDEAVETILLDALAKLVTWRAQPDEDLRPAKAIFAFAFGQGANGSLGRTNLALAAHLSAYVANHPLPIFAQWEIVNVLQHLDTAVNYRAIPQDGYLSTRGVVTQFKAAWETQFGAVQDTAVILIAHPDHQIRCRDLLLAAGFQPLIQAASIPWGHFGCDAYGYDSASSQPWTRSRAAFVAYELAIRFGGKAKSIEKTK